MGLFSKPGPSAQGYGEIDKQMHAGLRSAKTAEEADKIARDHGLKDADDAASWLAERS